MTDDKCADREGLVPIISDCVVYHVGACAWCGRDVPVSNSDGWTIEQKGGEK